MHARRPLAVLAALAVAALALAGWLALAPAQLGGSAAYAVVVGSSMEPSLERGDLGVVRRADAYRVGDVVLFESPRLGARVLHRIVAVEDGRFRTQGDNNGFVDPDPVDSDRVVGRLAVTLPVAGGVVTWLRAPAHAALVVGLAAALAVAGGLGAGAAVRPRRRRRGAGPIGAAVSPPSLSTARLVAFAAAGACLLVAFLAWTRPATRAVPVTAAYEQRGAFSAESRVARSPVYPDGRADTGEAVFLHLVQRLRVGFTYRFASELEHELTGSASLAAVLADGRGWERRIELVSPRPFSGDRVTLRGALDLRELRRTVAQVRRLTGADLATYALRIEPAVTVAGTLDDAPLRSSFAPALPFLLDPVRLSVDEQGAAAETLLAPTATGAGTRTVPATIGVGALRIDVWTARVLTVLAALLALGAGVALAPGGARRQPGAEREEIRARFGHLLLEAARPPALDPERVLELGDFESLARIAQRYDRFVLHVTVPGGDEYLVEDGGTVYRYRTGVPAPAATWADVPTLSVRR